MAQKSLDSLLMAYADLSGTSKGASFKGPPLKEVKREKPAAPEFKASAKARDWSCLEQALEDAFVVGPPSQSELQPGLGLGLTSWGGDQSISNQPTSAQTLMDDWGDFQGPAAAPGHPLPQGVNISAHPMHQQQTQPYYQQQQQQPHQQQNHQQQQQSLTNQEDDDFADFVTASFSTSQSYSGPPTSTVKPFSAHPSAASGFVAGNVFASPPSLVSHGLPVVSPSSVSSTLSVLTSPTGSQSNVVSQQPVLSNAVGLRLASFQEESPVHNFRKPEVVSASHAPSIGPPPLSSNPIINNVDDFDAFTSAVSAANLPKASASILPSSASSCPPMLLPTSSKSFPPPPTPSSSMVTSPVLPIQPTMASADKYAALADLFSMAGPEPQAPILATTGVTSEAESIPANLFNVRQSGGGDESLVMSGQSLKPTIVGAFDEEDFGDFIAVQGEHNESRQDVFQSSTSTTVIKNYAIPSWHETIPPPMPSEDHSADDHDFVDIVHGVNHSGSAASSEASTNISALNDDLDVNYFVPKATKNSMDTLGFPPSYSSPPDSLSLELPTTAIEPSTAEEATKQASPPTSSSSLSKPKNLVGARILPDLDKLKSPHREWCQALLQIQELLSAAGDAFSNISDDDVLAEVVESEAGLNYVRNLVEVFRVFKRIQMSYSMAIWNEAVQIQSEETEKAWKRFVLHLKTKAEALIPIRGVFDFSGCLVNNNVSAANVCGLCLLSLTTASRETTDVISEVVIQDKTSGYKYHSTCANFWVNCVNANLPKLI